MPTVMLTKSNASPVSVRKTGLDMTQNQNNKVEVGISKTTFLKKLIKIFLTRRYTAIWYTGKM